MTTPFLHSYPYRLPYPFHHHHRHGSYLHPFPSLAVAGFAGKIAVEVVVVGRIVAGRTVAVVVVVAAVAAAAAAAVVVEHLGSQSFRLGLDFQTLAKSHCWESKESQTGECRPCHDKQQDNKSMQDISIRSMHGWMHAVETHKTHTHTQKKKKRERDTKMIRM
jgi:cytochrome c553